MAEIFADIKISNPIKENSGVKSIRCVVNKQLYTHLMITKEVADELGFEEVEKRQEKIGDGPIEIFSYVGPVQLELNGRIGFVGALVNNEAAVRCHLGSIVIGEMDLIVLREPFIELGVAPRSILSTE